MANAISHSQAFISQDPINPYKFIIDGAQAEKDQKIEIQGAEIVQLKKARTTESHFDWGKHSVKEVKIKNVMIIDGIDLSFLVWLINKKVKITFSEAAPSVSPLILSALTNQLNRLNQQNITVITGSSIKIPIAEGQRGYRQALDACSACQQLGFKVIFC